MVVKILSENGSDIKQRNMDRRAVLRNAIYFLHRYTPRFAIVSTRLLWRLVPRPITRIVQFVLEHGIMHAPLLHCVISIDLKRRGTTKKKTVRKISVGFCKLLLENGADCNERDGDYLTPFLCAVQCSNRWVLQLLLDHGADITAVDLDGRTAIHYAAICSDTRVMEFLLAKGIIDIECCDKNGYSALHLAAKHGKPLQCELLLRSGAIVDVQNQSNGHTPLSFTISESQRTVNFMGIAQAVRVLLEYGADVGYKVEGLSILERAASEGISGSDSIRKVLMQHVAEMDYSNLELNEDDRCTIAVNGCYTKYFWMCIEELKSMKETPFYNGVSVLSLFLENEKTISEYARNDELVGAFLVSDFDNEFPMYFDAVRRRFYAAVETQKLRSSAATVLSSLFKFGKASHKISKKILSYLRDEDLKFLKM